MIYEEVLAAWPNIPGTLSPRIRNYQFQYTLYNNNLLKVNPPIGRKNHYVIATHRASSKQPILNDQLNIIDTNDNRNNGE